MNWLDYLPIVIPSLLTIIFAVLAIVLKWQKDNMTGLAKEVSEFLIAVCDGMKDKTVTPKELQKMIKEMNDVIEEARKLINK